jgi:uncharacterized protein (TIGR02687 family)
MAFDEGVRDRLQAACQESRLVFWEDEPGEFADSIGGLALDGVEVIIVRGNEFALKRRILRGGGDRVLVYRAGGAPASDFDYLLDVKLMSRPFSCSMASSWAEECGLAPSAEATLSAHATFFASGKRLQQFSSACHGSDWLSRSASREDIELGLLAVACGAKGTSRVDVTRDVARAVVRSFALERDLEAQVERYGLREALWGAMRAVYGYSSDAPSFADFSTAVVLTCCAELVGQEPTLGPEAALLLSSMSRDSAEAGAFEALMGRMEDVESLVRPEACDREALVSNPYLRRVDRWILGGLVADVAAGMDRSAEIADIEARRGSMHWFGEAKVTYEALLAASLVTAGCKAREAEAGACEDAASALRAYSERWCQTDAAYRRYHEALRDPGLVADVDLSGVRSLVEPRYGSFLRGLAIEWQDLACKAGTWPPAGIASRQRDFYASQVASRRDERVAVVASDAFRYECAVELADDLRYGSPRYQAILEPAMSMLPSYTQLGMAALLPNERISIDPATQLVSVDGRPATGMANREAVLAAAHPGARALKAEDVLSDGTLGDASEAGLVYVFHNKVDKTGDNSETERDVFGAAREAMRQIRRLVSILTRAGFDEVLVTADHGFLFQDKDPSGFEYASYDILPAVTSGGDASNTRRFVMAPTLPKADGMMLFPASSLGLEGAFDVAIPKGMRRLRLKGSGARFVHGGATLQETVIPVLVVSARKHRKAETVGASILTGGKTLITGNAVAFDLYQTDPVSASASKIHVRVFASAAGEAAPEAISPVEELDLASESEDTAARISHIRLPLASTVRDGQRVTVKVQRRVGETSVYADLASQDYTVRRSFGKDFE